MKKEIDSGRGAIFYKRRVEVCGGIASGKTTFASLMSRIGLHPLMENFRSNPFWEAFYSNPGKYIFETEVSFTLQHYHQIKKEEANSKINICDYSFYLDIAYAEIGLQGSKLKTFYAVYNEIKNELPPPALLVYLNCDAETELKRIRNRGRDVEKSIDLKFLDTLNKSVEHHATNAGKEINVVSIDSAKNNFVDDESAKKELLDLVSQFL